MITCSVCDHAQRGSIDALLASGSRPMRAVSADFAVSYDSLKRHRRNGHVPPVPGASGLSGQSPTVASGASPLDLMRGIVAALGQVDASRLSPSAQVGHFDSYRRAVEALSKMEPPRPPADDGRPTWEQVRELNAAMFAELEPYPAARMAMSRALRARLTQQHQEGA